MSEAVYIHGKRDIRLGAPPVEAPDDARIEIDVAAVGLCGSDLHYYKDGGIGAQQNIAVPFVPGHEFSGRLVKDYEPLGYTRGTLFAIDPSDHCGKCEWCRRDHFNLCPSVKFIGAPPFDGGMRPRMQVRPEALIPVPATLDAVDAAMLEPLGICIHAIDLAKPRLGETVAIIGCGPIGLGIIQLLRLSGIGKIVAIDPADYRAKRAVEIGADMCSDKASDVWDMTNGRGADLVIEATNSPAGFADATLAACIGGRVLLVGIPDGDHYAMPASEARRRALNVKFSRRMGDTYPRAIELAASGKVDLKVPLSHHLPLDKGPEAFQMQAELADGSFKTILYPNGM